ncbi:MAG: hypothetical protein ACK53F_05760 [Betaproteobacteria bacterium]
MDQLLKDYTPTSTSCDVKDGLPQTSSSKPEAKSLSWGESIAAALRELATNPEELAKIEKRAF